MLRVTDEAAGYLFVLLDHIEHTLPDDACFRLQCEDSEVLHEISFEYAGDDWAAHGDRTVLVWDPDLFNSKRKWTLELDESDGDEQLLLGSKISSGGPTTVTVVELSGIIRTLVDAERR